MPPVSQQKFLLSVKLNVVHSRFCDLNFLRFKALGADYKYFGALRNLEFIFSLSVGEVLGSSVLYPDWCISYRGTCRVGYNTLDLVRVYTFLNRDLVILNPFETVSYVGIVRINLKYLSISFSSPSQNGYLPFKGFFLTGCSCFLFLLCRMIN